MSNDQAVFSFELNESLYFEKGQEVDEIRGISLDPEISIQPFHDYISIRGVIELRGDYVKTMDDNQEQNDMSEFADDFQAKRFVEEVVDTEDGGAEFAHRFPVEISVPSYRVENLDEVTVSIDSFDYEMPEQRQLAFTSTITIHGINEQEQDEIPRDDTANTFIQGSDPTFDFDIKEDQQNLEEASSDKPAQSEYPAMPTLTNETESSDKLNSEDSSPERWKHKKTQSLAEFFKQEPEGPEQEPAESSSSYHDGSYSEQNTTDFQESSYSPESAKTIDDWGSPSSAANDPEWQSSVSNGWESSSSSSDVLRTEDLSEVTDSQHSSTSPQINENAETEENEGTDVRYLSDMFRDEEESFSRMRVCIVQEQDTLEMIADRYKMSTLQLIKQNRLDDDTISEGQLLYIPETK